MTENFEIIRSLIADDSEGSFLVALYPEAEPEFGLDGFIIQRMPEFEDILAPDERGAAIEWTEEDEIVRVMEVSIRRPRLTIRTKHETYAFDIALIPDLDYGKLIRVFRNMNFDSRYILNLESG